ARARPRSGAADLPGGRADAVQASGTDLRARPDPQSLLSGLSTGPQRAGRRRLAGEEPLRLVTFDGGRVGELHEDRIVELDVPTMLEYFEHAEPPQPTGGARAVEDGKHRALTVPMKGLH